jgi:hypothetical protein
MKKSKKARTIIKNCTFTGSATDAQCKAIEELALAVQKCAEALKGAPAIEVKK